MGHDEILDSKSGQDWKGVLGNIATAILITAFTLAFFPLQFTVKTVLAQVSVAAIVVTIAVFRRQPSGMDGFSQPAGKLRQIAAIVVDMVVSLFAVIPGAAFLDSGWWVGIPLSYLPALYFVSRNLWFPGVGFLLLGLRYHASGTAIAVHRLKIALSNMVLFLPFGMVVVSQIPEYAVATNVLGVIRNLSVLVVLVDIFYLLVTAQSKRFIDNFLSLQIIERDRKRSAMT